jgi:chromodomain-helicase-DNA-binding protein 1
LELIAKDAGLTEKKDGVLLDHCQKVIQACKKAIGSKKGISSLAAFNTLDSPSKDEPEGKRSSHIEFMGFDQINPSMLLQRIADMDLIEAKLKKLSNMFQFRFDTALKPVSQSGWSDRISWPVKDDAMLLVGIYLHGMTNWSEIESDERLGFKGRFQFSSSPNVAGPTPINLARRSEYLLKVFRDEAEAQRRADKRAKTQDRPKRKAQQLTLEDSSTISGPGKLLKPVQENLDAMAAVKGKDQKEAIAVIKEHILPVGTLILDLVKSKSSIMSKRECANFEKKLWKHVLGSWPFDNPSEDTVKTIFEKVLAKKRDDNFPSPKP